MRKKLVLLSCVLGLILSGCTAKNSIKPGVSIDDIDFSKSRYADTNTFETNLIRIAAKAEAHWKNYYSLLEKRKNLYDEKLNLHVPTGMGKNIDLSFEGHIGDLINEIGSQSGYEVVFKDMNKNSTPVTTGRYIRTSLWDILQMTMAKIPEYGLDIEEDHRKITLYPKY